MANLHELTLHFRLDGHKLCRCQYETLGQSTPEQTCPISVLSVLKPVRITSGGWNVVQDHLLLIFSQEPDPALLLILRTHQQPSHELKKSGKRTRTSVNFRGIMNL